MRNQRREYPQGRLRADINVTPLVDVCLVLLIIFMVVTPLMIGQIPLSLPEAERISAIEDEHPRLRMEAYHWLRMPENRKKWAVEGDCQSGHVERLCFPRV